ncbi:MAG: peptidoglycan DD-metalloendopeptidase family protein [Deltaproteobacteria bacterium]|nr:peptidoglycan DD-metalloendopeptidase family protein [Deltaproteobacteria bacterium]
MRALVAALVLAASAALAQDADLAELKRAIDERRERVAAYEREEQGLFAAIDAVDAAARALKKEVTRAEKAARDAAVKHVTLERKRSALEAEVARTEQLLRTRAVSLYKAGEAGSLALVFAPGTLRDRLTRIRTLQRMFDHDGALLARARAERAELEAARVAAAEATRLRDAARAALRQRRGELEAERLAKRELLARVRRDQARERALLNELEAAARALEGKLAEIDATPAATVAPPEAPTFRAQRGHLDPPVAGKLLRRFGKVIDAEYRTETFQKGVDFAVEVGEPVYAVSAGEVRFADWFAGYGRMVILDHGDGFFTVTGHLDTIDIELGQRVAAGDRLGAAGETGSLSGPRLYFEIRNGADAVDPEEWLALAPNL